jgi:hypothetical protein
MKKTPLLFQHFVLLALSAVLLLGAQERPSTHPVPDPLQQAAWRVLEAKCNVCHRKQNPFLIFKLSNMNKRAPRIHRAVFVQRRMPKAGGMPLTPEEYATLEQWLNTQIDLP